MRNTNSLLALTCLVALVLTVGCSNSAEQKLIGKWELDKEAMKEAMENAKKNKEGDPAAGMGAAMMAAMDMSFEFRKDGTATVEISMMGQSDSKDGTWEATSADGGDLNLTITVDDDPGTAKASFSGNDTLILKNFDTGDGTMGPGKLTFNRVK